MAIIQSDWGSNRLTPNRPQTAGAVHVTRFVYELAGEIDTTDILELGILPAYAYLVGARVTTEGTWIVGGADVTADIGIMSGEPGDRNVSRTVGDELFDGVNLDDAKTAVQTSDNPDLPKVAPSDKHRSIGVKFSAKVGGSSATKIILDVFYAQ